MQPQSWVREGNQPVISLGQPGEFDDTHIFAPCVQQEHELFRLWYCGSRGKVEDRVFEMGLASSRDGRKFEKSSGNPVFRFGDGKHSILTPTILRENGQWRMWFAATDFANGKGLHTLHDCTSSDGIHWSARMWYASRTKPPFKNKYLAIGTAIWNGPPAIGGSVGDRPQSAGPPARAFAALDPAMDRVSFSTAQNRLREQLRTQLGIPREAVLRTDEQGQPAFCLEGWLQHVSQK